MRGVGRLAQVTIAVEDVADGRDFWSTVTGLAVTDEDLEAGWADLEPATVTAAGPVLTLHRATLSKPDTSANRGHVDLTVTDVDVAITRIRRLGGDLKVGPALYPRPLSDADGTPEIDWAVATDPFGNEFCVIRDIDEVEREALRDSPAQADAPTHSTWHQRRLSSRFDDDLWRQIARAARYPDGPPDVDGATEPATPVGQLRCCVINVDDLAVALHFWSALVDVGPIVSEWPFRFAYLGDEDESQDHWRHQLILQRSSEPCRDDVDRVHYDIEVSDLASAVAQVRWMGGIPGSTTSERLQLAMHRHDSSPRVVMRDRSGNSFCLVQRERPRDAADAQHS